MLGFDFVDHAAFAGEDGAGLYGEFVDEYVAADAGGAVEREEFFDGEVAVDGAYDVGVLAEDVARDDAGVADDELAVELYVALEGAVEAEVACGDDVAFDNCAVGDDVDGGGFHFHCLCHGGMFFKGYCL